MAVEGNLPVCVVPWNGAGYVIVDTVIHQVIYDLCPADSDKIGKRTFPFSSKTFDI